MSERDAVVAARPPLYQRAVARISAIDEGAIRRVAFCALLIGTASVLYVD